MKNLLKLGTIGKNSFYSFRNPNSAIHNRAVLLWPTCYKQFVNNTVILHHAKNLKLSLSHYWIEFESEYLIIAILQFAVVPESLKEIREKYKYVNCRNIGK